MGAFFCEWVEVTAADRAAATIQRFAPITVNKQGSEGVAGAIGKLPDGLRPPPRLRRGEIPVWLLPQKEQSCAKRMTEGTSPLARSQRLCQPPRPQRRLSETRPTFRRNPLRRKSQPERPPLFGSGGLGERCFSQRSSLSPRIFLPNLFGREREGGDFSTEKSPPSQSLKYPHR